LGVKNVQGMTGLQPTKKKGLLAGQVMMIRHGKLDIVVVDTV